MSDPTFSDSDFQNEMAWAWATEKSYFLSCGAIIFY